MSVYRDPEPFTVEQIDAAFMRTIMKINKPTYDAAGFYLIEQGLRRDLGVPVAVQVFRPEEHGLRVVTRWNEPWQQVFVRHGNRYGFELESVPA